MSITDAYHNEHPPIYSQSYDEHTHMYLFTEVPTGITIQEADHGLRFHLPSEWDESTYKKIKNSKELAKKLIAGRQLIRLEGKHND